MLQGHGTGRENTRKKPRIYTTSFAAIHALYVAKAERKGRTRGEVDRIILWLTGHDRAGLEAQLAAATDVETFLAQAPRMNPARLAITGRVCGVRVEEIKDPVMRDIRRLDLMIDELARGTEMGRILRDESGLA